MEQFSNIENLALPLNQVDVETFCRSVKEIEKSVKILKKNKIDFALMHTTNSYPTKDSDVSLGAMQQMMDLYKNVPIGLSDHSIGNIASFSGLALGADIIERHFTDTHKRKGPDIVCSMNAKQCKELVNAAKRIYQMRGGKKGLMKSEKNVAKFAFGSVVTISDIKKGQKFSKSNIWVKRPGTGQIKAEDFNTSASFFVWAEPAPFRPNPLPSSVVNVLSAA